MMAGYDIVHVAIAPPDMLEASLIKQVAAILNKDLYATRLLLAGKIPKIVAHYETTQVAESVAKRLKGLGIVTVVCKDSELHQHSSVSFRAHTLKLGEGEVIFWDKSSEARGMNAENVFLILEGRMQTYTDTEVTSTKMKFNLPATVLTGGIPIWRRVNETTKGISVETEYFVRLYDQASPEPRVEIFESDFDYSFLGTKISPSSFTNLITIITELRNRFPRAVFDDRLTLPFAVDMPFATPGDEIDINCKLIYLCHQAVNSLGPSA